MEIPPSGSGSAEAENNGSSSRKGSSHSSVSRWSPTKEQIAMLENFYRQGIRTPNTDQIQQITSRLRAYGHIEGKNVFYWFQNHKARQRQKLKQQNQQTNRFLPICQNVACSPYYLQQSGISFYPQQSTVGMRQQDYNHRNSNREALTLFPLHPTGILKDKTTTASVSVDITDDTLAVDHHDAHLGNQPFFNFFHC